MISVDVNFISRFYLTAQQLTQCAKEYYKLHFQYIMTGDLDG